MLLAVGEELIDDIHDAAEQRRADGQALLLVRGASPHLIERLRGLADVQSPDGPRRRLGPGGHFGHSQHRVETECFVQMIEEPGRVAVEQDRRLARRPNAGRLHLGLVDRAGGEAQIVEDLGGDGELDQIRPARSDSHERARSSWPSRR